MYFEKKVAKNIDRAASLVDLALVHAHAHICNENSLLLLCNHLLSCDCHVIQYSVCLCLVNMKFEYQC